MESADAEAEALVDSSKDAKKTKEAKRSRLLVVGAILCGLNSGIFYSGSYMIKIVETSCPTWSKSSTVIGQSLALGIGALSGVVNSRIVKRIGLRPSLVVALVLGALTYGLCGVVVSQCGLAAEIAYVALFAVAGIRVNFLLFAWLDSLIAAFPRRHGFAASVFSAAVGVGSIGYGQYFLFAQRLHSDGVLDAATIFFIVGIFVVLTTTIAIVLATPVKIPRRSPKDDKREKRESSKVVWGRVTSWRFILLFVGRFIIMMAGFGLISRQQDFLEVIWHTESSKAVHQLLTIVMVAYTAARILWVFISDRVGIKNLWVVTASLQSLSLALITIFIIYGVDVVSVRYVAICFYALFMACFSAPKSTLPALIAEIWDAEEATVTAGMFSPSFGLAGLIGPLILEAMYRRWHGFTVFLLESSGMALLGVLLIIAVRKKKRDYVLQTVQASDKKRTR